MELPAPPFYGTRQHWEAYIAELRKLPASPDRDGAIEFAEFEICQISSPKKSTLADRMSSIEPTIAKRRGL